MAALCTFLLDHRPLAIVELSFRRVIIVTRVSEMSQAANEMHHGPGAFLAKKCVSTRRTLPGPDSSQSHKFVPLSPGRVRSCSLFGFCFPTGITSKSRSLYSIGVTVGKKVPLPGLCNMMNESSNWGYCQWHYPVVLVIRVSITVMPCRDVHNLYPPASGPKFINKSIAHIALPICISSSMYIPVQG